MKTTRVCALELEKAVCALDLEKRAPWRGGPISDGRLKVA